MLWTNIGDLPESRMEFVERILEKINRKHTGLISIIGPVFAGKTTLLLELSRSAKVPVYFPNNHMVMTSHSGASLAEGVRLNSIKDLPSGEILLVDELCHFCYLSSCGTDEVINTIEDKRKTGLVVVATFDLFWDLKMPEIVNHLLTSSDILCNINAKCMYCGNPAGFSYCTEPIKSGILTSAAKFIPLCADCHPLTHKAGLEKQK